MAVLLYSAITSLDGYVADEHGTFEFLAPDEEVHAAVNDLMRTVGTQLYGRRLYGVMLAWETWDIADESAATQDFATMWRDTDKIVYSTTLETVSSERTRIERTFDPVAVGALRVEAARDLLVGGPDLAGQAFKAGLVDEVHLFVSPVVVGGGTRALPDHLRLDLTLVDERRFANGVVHLHYRTRGES
jgi:dihydrofolate reductase